MTSLFTVKSIHMINSWTYNLPKNTECTICRCNLNCSSLYHQDKGLDSYVVTGVCSHSFHYECIKPWVDKNKYCPICAQEWKYIQPTRDLPKMDPVQNYKNNYATLPSPIPGVAPLAVPPNIFAHASLENIPKPPKNFADASLENMPKPPKIDTNIPSDFSSDLPSNLTNEQKDFYKNVYKLNHTENKLENKKIHINYKVDLENHVVTVTKKSESPKDSESSIMDVDTDDGTEIDTDDDDI